MFSAGRPLLGRLSCGLRRSAIDGGLAEAPFRRQMPDIEHELPDFFVAKNIF